MFCLIEFIDFQAVGLYNNTKIKEANGSAGYRLYRRVLAGKYFKNPYGLQLAKK
jgi:hypothetical protein